MAFLSSSSRLIALDAGELVFGDGVMSDVSHCFALPEFLLSSVTAFKNSFSRRLFPIFDGCGKSWCGPDGTCDRSPAKTGLSFSQARYMATHPRVRDALIFPANIPERLTPKYSRRVLNLAHGYAPRDPGLPKQLQTHQVGHVGSCGAPWQPSQQTIPSITDAIGCHRSPRLHDVPLNFRQRVILRCFLSPRCFLRTRSFWPLGGGQRAFYPCVRRNQRRAMLLSTFRPPLHSNGSRCSPRKVRPLFREAEVADVLGMSQPQHPGFSPLDN